MRAPRVQRARVITRGGGGTRLIIVSEQSLLSAARGRLCSRVVMRWGKQIAGCIWVGLRGTVPAAPILREGEKNVVTVSTLVPKELHSFNTSARSCEI
jgi:hypothetical protein